MRPTTVRPTPIVLAAAAGALFAVTASLDIPHHQPDPFAAPIDYVLESFFSLSLGAGALTALTLLRAAGSRIAQAGWAFLGLGYAALTVVTAGTAVNGADVLDPVFGIALLAISVGSVVLFAADVAGRVRPKGAGVVSLVGLVAMMALGEGYGLLAWSAVWFAVAALSRVGTQLPSTSRDLIRASSAS